MKISRHVIQALCVLGLWLGWGLHAHAQTDTVTYVYTDPQGTPLVEADAQGNVIARYDYTPYGNAVTSLGSAPNGPGYTGHVNDPETGLVYMQARYYDPAVGRFLSTDPVGPNPGNLFNFNRYDYTSNNPINYTDPDGRCPDGMCGEMLSAHVQWRLSHPNAPADGLEKAAFVALGVMAAPVVAAAAPEVGAGVLAETAADTSASVAIDAATEASVAAQASGATSGATTGLVTESGEVFTGASTNAGGAGSATNGVVQQALDDVAPEARSAFHGCCGEINAASKASNAGAKLQGSTMATVRAAGRQAGKLMEACSSCRAVAEKLGIKIVEPPTSLP